MYWQLVPNHIDLFTHSIGRYYNYTISDNGVSVNFSDKYQTDYLTNLISNRTSLFIEQNLALKAEARAVGGPGAKIKPFFTWIGVPAAHGPFTPAPQYINVSEGELAPRFPNYNMVRGIHSDTKDTNMALFPRSFKTSTSCCGT